MHTPQLILCCGINRSGSTWVYQILQGLLKGEKTIDVGFIGDDISPLIEAIENNPRFIIGKLHEYPKAIEKLLEKHDNQLFYSHRDLRGCIVSLMNKTNSSFEKVFEMPFFSNAVADFALWSKWNNNAFIAYDDIRYRPMIAAQIIGDNLKVNLDRIPNLVDELSFDKQRKRIKSFNSSPKTVLLKLMYKIRLVKMPKDEDSLLHYNHIQSGGSKDWEQTLTKSQSEKVKERYKDWMTTFRYV